jgi:predicted dehydrogenase
MAIAIVGMGSAGRRHARNLLALGRSDILLVRAGGGQGGPLEPPLDGLPTAPSLAAAVDSGATAVVVANPTALHAATTLEAVQAGCHVLVEKPISHQMDSLEDIAAHAGEHRVAVLVGYQYRFHPTLRRVREATLAGRIGSIVAVHAHWGEYLPDWHPEEDYRLGYSARAELGGGVVRTLSHPIDYLRWLAGEVSEVAAFVSPTPWLDTNVEAVAVAALRFESGALGTLSLDYLARPTRHELHVIGTEGRIQWNGLTGETRYWCNPGDEPVDDAPSAGFTRNDLFLDEMRHFLACCEGAAEPTCTIADGVRALEIALAMSAGQPPVGSS